ncbi:unnamed protein product, partial [Gadus morhua 'NCC']
MRKQHGGRPALVVVVVVVVVVGVVVVGVVVGVVVVVVVVVVVGVGVVVVVVVVVVGVVVVVVVGGTLDSWPRNISTTRYSAPGAADEIGLLCERESLSHEPRGNSSGKRSPCRHARPRHQRNPPWSILSKTFPLSGVSTSSEWNRKKVSPSEEAPVVIREFNLGAPPSSPPYHPDLLGLALRATGASVLDVVPWLHGRSPRQEPLLIDKGHQDIHTAYDPR